MSFARCINIFLKMKVVISGYGRMGRMVEKILSENAVKLLGL